MHLNVWIAVYLGILCAVMLVLLAWLIVQLVRSVRGKNDDQNVIRLQGTDYRIVPVDRGQKQGPGEGGYGGAPEEGEDDRNV